MTHIHSKTDSIRVSKIENGVITVSLHRPEVHNAFNQEVIEGLSDIFTQIEANSSIKVMVLSAEGKHFCAGADLNMMKESAHYSHEKNLSDARALADMLYQLNHLTIPTIAKVRGAVYGGAVGLVSCCDIAIAAKQSKFCLSEVKIGLIPATISPYVVAAIGARMARRYFLTAEVIDSQAALDMHLIHELCTTKELDSQVEKVCRSLIHNAPIAVSQSKKLIFDVDNAKIDESLKHATSKAIADIRASEEGQEGLDAFLNKRTPSWQS